MSEFSANWGRMKEARDKDLARRVSELDASAARSRAFGTLALALIEGERTTGTKTGIFGFLRRHNDFQIARDVITRSVEKRVATFERQIVDAREQEERRTQQELDEMAALGF